MNIKDKMKNLPLRKTLKLLYYQELFGKKEFILESTGRNHSYFGARFVRLKDGKYIDFIWKTKYTFQIEIGYAKIKWSNDGIDWWCAYNADKPIFKTLELNYFGQSLIKFIDSQIRDNKLLKSLII